MDFKLLVDTLLTGTPIAILVAGVGLLWQVIYTHGRDKIHDRQAARELKLEEQKFKYQQKIEEFKFNYEKLRWREELTREIMLKHIDIRLEEYSKVWSYIEGFARHKLEDNKFTPDDAKSIAQKLKTWRYSKGGLLAEEITRDAVFALQKALWEYDGSKPSYEHIRYA